MIGGYVRLSRDDDKRNYISIENQKMMIEDYAKVHQMKVDIWYEDDGISGYLFDRPGFNQMIKDLNNELTCVLVKDFSRIGRHNAKVLLLLDEFQMRGKHLIVIDDQYDSFKEEDDSIGIKTWYNERYVKDASKKIRNVITARQKNGSYQAAVPYGYIRDQKEIKMVPEEAETIRYLFSLYLSGFGYRRIAEKLNEELIMTPSMAQHERMLKEGKISRKKVADHWSEGMVKDILANDFYIGTYRLHKRTRPVIHGKEVRVSEKEQYVYKHHHAPIIEDTVFQKVKEEKENRIRNRQRQTKRGKNPFAGIVFCKECGSNLTPITRLSGGNTKKYYVCSTYNSKGKRYCAKSHLVKEEELMEPLLKYLLLCKSMNLEKMLFGMKTPATNNMVCEYDRRSIAENRIEDEIKTVIAQKIRDLTMNPGQQEVIHTVYDALLAELVEKRKIALKSKEKGNGKEVKTLTEEERVEVILQRGRLTKEEVHSIVEKMTVDEEGTISICLKKRFNTAIEAQIVNQLNSESNHIICFT